MDKIKLTFNIEIMWELFVHDSTIEVGCKLRYRLLTGQKEIINEGEICRIGYRYFWVVTTKYNGLIIEEENQQVIKYNFSDLHELGFERLVEQGEN
jgi:hypothetical protein